MAALGNNYVTTNSIDTTVREIDFVSRFTNNIQALNEILGIMRPIRKTLGTKLVASTATVTLQDGDVAEGEEVPYSAVRVDPVYFEDITLKKYRKAVTAEAVAKYGPEVAAQKTDDAFIAELQGNILDTFYGFMMETATEIDNEETFQMAISMAVANVKDKFKKMRKDYGNVVVFVNTLDAGRYLGSANITVQNRNGIEYVKDFLGVQTMIISSEIEPGAVIATPADNIVEYYIDPADGGFQQLGLNYTTANGDTNLIGIHKEGNYGRVMGETHALMGVTLFPEFVDAIAICAFGAQEDPSEEPS